tara:strand:- start:1080 stop:2135 length:1056 start_codon:yes stop_codon:yes gene_type:complete
MDVFDKILKENSWKFKKGYPDIKDIEDKTLLEKIINGYLTEAEEDINIDIEDKEVLGVKKAAPPQPKIGSDVYNGTIKRVLNVEVIPTTPSKYKWNGPGGSTFTEQVKPADKEIFDKLYGAKPPKKGKEEGTAGSLGVGNGEIALYWLYNFSNSGVSVTEGREGDDPDLRFNDVGVEVKAYKNPNGTVGLGRFGADKENLALLSIIFGLNTLSSVLGDEPPQKSVNPTNFNGEQLEQALEVLIDFDSIDGLDGLANTYPLFKSIQNNIETVKSKIGDFDTAKAGAILMADKLVRTKLERKPGSGGYLANVQDNGGLKFFQIDLDKLKSDELLNSFKVSQSAILVKFSNIFN